MRVQSIEMHAISSFDDEKTASGQPARRELAHVSGLATTRLRIFSAAYTDWRRAQLSGDPSRASLAPGCGSEPGRYRIGIFRRRACAMGSSGSIPFICHDAMKTCLQDSCQAKTGD
jgi:hypothetical protein